LGCATGLGWEARARCVADVPRWARDGSAVAAVLCDCIRFLGWSLLVDDVLDDSWLAGEWDAEFEAEPEADAELEGFWVEGLFPMAIGSYQMCGSRKMLNT